MQDSINLLVAYGRGMTRAAQAELGCHRAIWRATGNSLLPPVGSNPSSPMYSSAIQRKNSGRPARRTYENRQWAM